MPERRTVLLPDVTGIDTLQPWRELVRPEGIRSVLAVPLGDHDGEDAVAGVFELQVALVVRDVQRAAGSRPLAPDGPAAQ